MKTTQFTTKDQDAIPSLIAGYMSEAFPTKFPKELFRTDAKNGGEFVVYERDIKGGPPQDKVMMYLVKNGKVEKNFGSHVNLAGAKKFAKNNNII